MSSFVKQLEDVVAEEWAKIRSGYFFETAQEEFSRELYVRVMKEIYHYTKNNSINQAAAAFAEDYRKVKLLRFAYKHAMEELGHENMIVRDLDSIGVGYDEIVSQSPLPATQALNGYLYSIAVREGVIPRLGYSFWAEEAYDHIQPVLDSARRSLNLSDDQMTFFVAHSAIDEKHSEEVRAVIDEWVRTDEERAAVIETARTTLFLTGQILDQAAAACAQVDARQVA
ncbi:MAG: iron-containing redox enzyme family protein [Pseudomonadota bacterium]